MLLPYVLLLVLAVGFISNMITLVASGLYPGLVFVFSLLTAASVGHKNTFYKTEAVEKNKQENDTEEDEDDEHDFRVNM